MVRCLWTIGWVCWAWVAGPVWALNWALGDVVTTSHVRAELQLYSPQGLTMGAQAWAGLRLEHQAGWHSYWKNPGDSGLPTRLTWELPPGMVAAAPLWPTPDKIRLGHLANYGYTDTVWIAVPLQVTQALAGESVTVALEAEWLVCKEECIPERGRFQVRWPTQAQTASYPQWAQAQQRLPQDLPPQPQNRLTPENGTLAVVLHGLPRDWVGQGLEIFPETAGLVAAGADWEQKWVGPVWQARLPLGPDRTEAPSQVALVLQAQDRSVPGVRVEVRVQGAWPDRPGQDKLPTALENALRKRPAEVPENTASGFWAAWGGAFLGGLLLNLMPCVFPVLAIKILALTQHVAQRRVRRQSGLAYSLGTVLSFVVLGGILLLLRQAGEQIGWGFQLQNPSIVAGLAGLFMLLACNLMGWLELRAWVPQSLTRWGVHHPAADAFLTGVLAVAVAAPCTAPFMGAALGLALGLPNGAALAVFAAMGLGLGLPYSVASVSPWLGRHLPRPGAWMVTLRQLLAFPMWATVVWLLSVLGQQSGLAAVTSVLLGLLCLGGVVWLRQQARVWQAWVGPLLGLCLIGWFWQAAPDIDPPPTPQAVPNALPGADGQWHPWTVSTMEQLQTKGQTVLVDYTAAWCVTCQYNKGTVWNDAALRQTLAQAGVVLLRADWTRRDPDITTALATIGRSGVPTYAFYPAQSSPVLLPELPTRSDVEHALQGLQH